MSEVYAACMKMVTTRAEQLGTESEQGKRFASYVKAIPKILGYGIGMQAKEEQLAIKEENHRLIEAGMTFNVRITLTNFSAAKKDGGKQSNARNCLMIADTIFVTADGCEVMTQGINRNFNDISYNLDDEENVAEEQSTAQHSVVNSSTKTAQKPKEKP